MPDQVYPYETRNRVGNGGFSLRKVETHHRLSLVMKDAIDHYLRQPGTHHFHEDVFWSVEPSKRGHPHRTPGVAEALAFAWDINPERLFALAGGRLPMAAHGWYKGRHLRPSGRRTWRRRARPPPGSARSPGPGGATARRSAGRWPGPGLAQPLGGGAGPSRVEQQVPPEEAGVADGHVGVELTQAGRG